MKLLKLYIKNINSLQGEFELDFTDPRFVDNPVFAIVGEIGAGKSTILDCICLALYQRTPRLDRATDSVLNSGGLVSIGTTEAYAKVEFENNGKVYRSSWTASAISRGENKGQFNSGSIGVFLEEQQSGAFVSLEDSTKKSQHTLLVNELVGLDFHQFSKTILLAQGSFAKLLKAKENDRTAIIEQLTGTQNYRQIGKAVYDTDKALAVEIAKLESNLEGQKKALLTDEALTIHKQELSAIQADLITKNKAFEALSKLVQLIEKHDELNTKLQKANAQKTQLSEQEQAIKAKEHSLKQHHIVTEIIPNISQKNKAAEELKVYKATLETKEQFKKTVEDGLVAVKKDLQESFPTFSFSTNHQQDCESISEQLQGFTNKISEKQKERDRIQKELDALKSTIQSDEEKKKAANIKIEGFNAALKQSQEFLNNNKIEAQQLSSNIECWDTSENKIANIKASYSKYQLSGIDEQSVANVKDEFPEDLWATGDALKSEVATVNLKISDEKNAWNNDIKTFHELSSLLSDIEAKHKQIEVLKKDRVTLVSAKEKGQKTLADLEKALATINEKYSHLFKENDQINVLRSDLEAGKECVVCGSTEHPFAKENNEILVAIGKAKLEEEKLKKQQQVEEKKLSEIDSDIRLIDSKIPVITGLVDDANKSIVSKKGSFSRLKLEKGMTAEKAEAQKEVAIKAFEEQRKKTIAQLEAIQLVAAKRMYAELKLETQSILEVKKSLSSLSFLNQMAAFALKDAIELRDRLVNVKNSVENRDNLIKEAKISLSALTERMTQQAKESTTKTEALAKITEEYSAEVEKLKRFTSRENANDYVREVKTKLASFEKDSTVLETEIKGIASDIKKKTDGLAIITASLEKQIVEKGFATEADVLAAQLSPEQFAQIETIIAKYKEEVQSVAALIQEYNQSLKQLDAVADEDKARKAELAVELKKLEEEKVALVEGKGKLQQILNAHTETIKSIEAEVAAINTKKEAKIPYSLLNKAIGSADGDKFAKVAARFTFNKLLEFTNYHLKTLKSRYSFKSLDTLSDSETDLFILDSEMGLAERPAKSTLSGGETFLTSLCLALALSDLSSQKVRLGSLFIDEGFGSLDENACEEALTLLENLPDTTNKTVGIISHVGPVKQRISNQVLVQKLGDGRSKIVLS